MRLPISFLILAFLLSVTSYAQPVPVELHKMPDYYYVGDLQLKSGVNFFVLTERKDFDKMFGRTNRPDTPHFTKEVMLVMLVPETNKDAKLEVNKVNMKAGDFVEVYCDIDLNKGKLPYKTYPIGTYVIPRFKGTDKIRFYDNRKMKLLETVEIDD